MSKDKKEITIGGIKFLAINLGEPLKENLEVYPGDPLPKKQIFRDISKTGDHHYIWTLSDHNFHPHGDAPKHQNPEMKDKGFDFFGMDFFFNKACMIDLSKIPEAEEHDGLKYVIKIEKKYLESFKEIIQNKGALIIRTGYDKWIEENKPHEPKLIPYLTREAVDFITSFSNLKVLGIDSLTVDEPGRHYAHQKFKNLLIVESMVHLYQIPEEHYENFDLQTATVPFVGATGGPITAFALIKK